MSYDENGDKPRSPYDPPKPCVPVSARDWKSKKILICCVFASLLIDALTLIFAIICFVSGPWMRTIGWIYGYCLHALILGVPLSFFIWLVLQHDETGTRLVPLWVMIAIGIACSFTAVLSWIVVGFGVLLRM